MLMHQINAGQSEAKYNPAYTDLNKPYMQIVPFDDNIFGLIYFKVKFPYAAFIQGGQIIDEEVQVYLHNNFAYGLGGCRVGQDDMFVLWTGQAEETWSQLVTKEGGNVRKKIDSMVNIDNPAINLNCRQLSNTTIGVYYMKKNVDDGSPGYDNPYGIFMKIYDIPSESYGSRIQVNDDAVGYQYNIELTKKENGNILAGFYSDKTVNSLNINEQSIYIQEFDTTGAKVGSNKLVIQDTTDLDLTSDYTLASQGNKSYIAWADAGDIYFRRYDDSMTQQCQFKVVKGTHPRFVVYEDIAYLRFFSDSKAYIMELDAENCSKLTDPEYELDTELHFQEEMAITASSDRVTIGYLNSGYYDGNFKGVQFSEYFIKETINNCPDTQLCSACFGSYSCKICNGDTLQDRLIKDKTTGDCRCIQGYYDNSGSCTKCHFKCQACTTYDQCGGSCSHASRDPGNNCECSQGYFEEGFSKCTQNDRIVVPEDYGYNIATGAGVPKTAGHLPSTSNNAFQFSGSNWMILGTQTFGREGTITFWIKFGAFHDNSHIFDCGTGFGTNNILIQTVGTTGQIMAGYYRDSQFNKGYSQETTTLGQWEHWTFTLDDEGTIKLYKNGVEGTTNEDYQNRRFRKDQMTDCFIAKTNDAGDSNFQGEIEQLRIYHRVLSDEEIQSLADKDAYCQHQCGSCSGSPDSCDTCSDPNRDFGNSCKCKGGYINLGTRPECQENGQVGHDYILEGRDAQNFGTTDGPGVMPNTNSAMIFDGTGYRDFGTTHFGGDFSITSWVKFDQIIDYTRILDFGNGQQLDNIVLCLRGTYTQVMISLVEGSSSRFSQFGVRFNIAQWFQLTMVKQAGQLAKFYIDGVSDDGSNTGNANFQPIVMNRTNSYIGKSNWASNELFQGAIDQLRIYNRILTDEEISNFAQISATCNNKCLYCEGTPDNCTKCPGKNRDLDDNCNCQEGYYEDNSIDCKPIFPCSQKQESKLEILAIDGTTPQGKLFHFNKSQLDEILGQNDWDSQTFSIYSERLGKILQVKLYQSLQGGSQGDSSGRIDPEIDQGFFKIGDFLEFRKAAVCQSCQGQFRQLPYCTCMPGYYEIQGQDDCQLISSQNCQQYDTQIKVLSADSSLDANPGHTTGMHFNFDAQEFDRIFQSTSWDQKIVEITNMNTQYRSLVQLYRSQSNGQSQGDSYGKLLDNDPLQYFEAFKTDDILDLQIPSTCIKCQVDYRRLPNCECAYGYTEVNGNCQRNLIMGDYCSNFYHLQAQTGDSGFVKIFQNNQEITDLPTTSAGDQKGITAVIINKDDFTITDKKIYDIQNNPTDEAQFQTDITALDADTLVLIGIQDINTGSNLSSVGIDTLKSLGANSALTIASKSSYLLIGKKGVSQGSRTEWYEPEFPQLNSINLFQDSNEQISFISGCLDNPYQPISYTTCHTIEELNLYDGVTSYKNKKTLPNLIQYTNIPHIIQDAVFLSGDYDLSSTSDCTISTGIQGEAFIFIENDTQNPYKTLHKDGDLSHHLLDNGWTLLQDNDQTMVQIHTETNKITPIKIYKQSYTSDIIFPQILLQEFSGGIAFKTQVCHPSCSTCNGSSVNQCQQCDPTHNREKNSDSECECKDGFLDDFQNSGSYICKEDPSAQDPQPTPTNITDSIPRLPQRISFFTVQVGDLQIQVQKCQTNQNCDECDSEKCSTCLGENRDSSLYCLCSAGYYENPRSKKCEKCSPKCKQCYQGPNNCVECSLDQNRNSTDSNCGCDLGYFENKEGNCVIVPEYQQNLTSSFDWWLALFFAIYISIVLFKGYQYYSIKLKEKNSFNKKNKNNNSLPFSQNQEYNQAQNKQSSGSSSGNGNEDSYIIPSENNRNTSSNNQLLNLEENLQQNNNNNFEQKIPIQQQLQQDIEDIPQSSSQSQSQRASSINSFQQSQQKSQVSRQRRSNKKRTKFTSVY